MSGNKFHDHSHVVGDICYRSGTIACRCGWAESGLSSVAAMEAAWVGHRRNERLHIYSISEWFSDGPRA